MGEVVDDPFLDGFDELLLLMQVEVFDDQGGVIGNMGQKVDVFFSEASLFLVQGFDDPDTLLGPIDQRDADEVFGLELKVFVDIRKETGVLVRVIDHHRCLLLKGPANDPLIRGHANPLGLESGSHQGVQLLGLGVMEKEGAPFRAEDGVGPDDELIQQEIHVHLRGDDLSQLQKLGVFPGGKVRAP